MFAALIQRTGKRALILAHRSELVHQARKRLAEFGIQAEIEMADHRASTSRLYRRTIVATPQTLFSGSNGATRMTRFRPEDFDIVIADECFPSGTMVSGTPIEKLSVGDMVDSYNHATGGIECRRVTATHKNKPKALVTVRLSNGQEIVCTAGHPFWSADANRYVEAIALYENERICTHENLSGLRSHVRTSEPKENDVLAKVPVQHLRGEDGGNKSPACICANEGAESDAFAGHSGQSESHAGCDESQAAHARRERHGANGSAEDACGCSRLGNGARNSYEDTGRVRFSDSLQSGHCERGENGSRGSGRELALCDCPQGAGQKENAGSGVVRVDSVEVHEPRCDGGFGRLCPDGFVYNIEVEGNHNYFASGILVHNCHHYVSPAYMDVLKYFRQHSSCKLLGVTATPDRADGEALAKIFESVAFNVDILQGIDGGWLVPVRQFYARIEGLDYSHVRTTAGDLNGADLARVLENEKISQQFVQATLEQSYGLPEKWLSQFDPKDWGEHLKATGTTPKRTLIFTASVAQADQLAGILNRVLPGDADWLCGETPKELRADKLKRFKQAQTSYLVNCAVLTEGFDDYGIGMVVIVRPTKSRSLYAQMVGRGTRTLPGVDKYQTSAERRAAIAASAKPFLTVIDGVGNSGRHDLVTTADILGGKVSEEAREKAKKKIEEKGEAADIREELEAAELEALREIEEAKKRAAADKAHLVARASYSLTYVDAFSDFKRNADKWLNYQQKKLSRYQRDKLTSAGFDPDRMPLAEAIAEFKKLITPKPGLRWVMIHKYGISPQVANSPDLSIGQAWKYINAEKKRLALSTPS
jgi:superfamily II DNA or RNA helicase